MRPCDKCLENNWSFENIENIVRATCQFCGYEVEWEPKEKTFHKCSRCRKCGGTLKRHTFKHHKTNALYWFLWGWKCVKCHRIYNDEKSKVYKK